MKNKVPITPERAKPLEELEQFETDGTFDRLPKKEVALLKKEKDCVDFFDGKI